MNAWLAALTLIYVVALPVTSRRPQVIVGRVRRLRPSHFTSNGTAALSTVCGELCVLHESQPEDRRLDYETVYPDGRRTLTAVKATQGIGEGVDVKSARSRRQIYGPDVRFSISRAFRGDFPFTSAVRVSTGCTGMLVTERHVLTTAHCVHDGRDYVHGARQLRVGFLRRGALRWVRVRSTCIPRAWIGAAAELSMDYDYALLELRRPHPYPYMSLAVSPPLRDLAGHRLHFSGYDSDRPGELVYRSCRVQEQTTHLLYQHCDARPGASGSGVYGRLRSGGRWRRRVIGVFSGHQWVEVSGEPREYNVAVRLTPPKYAQICYWIRRTNGSCPGA